MNEYIRQFYYEGIGDIFYAKPEKIIVTKIKNKTIKKIMLIILKILYIIFAIICSIASFYVMYPF